MKTQPSLSTLRAEDAPRLVREYLERVPGATPDVAMTAIVLGQDEPDETGCFLVLVPKNGRMHWECRYEGEQESGVEAQEHVYDEQDAACDRYHARLDGW